MAVLCCRMSLRFSLMGPVRAWRDEEEIELGPRQQRSVLAALLLNNGVRLSNEQLIGMVWDDPTPSAVMALRTYMYKIRKALPELDLRSRDGGYTARAEIVDDCRGEPLEGLRGTYFDAQRVRLGDHRLKAREDCLERGLDVLELQEHVAAFPLRERPRALLMRALYLDGRQGEALDHYHRARALLDEELGLEPGPELRRVHAQILSGSLTAPHRPEQLLPDLVDFTGRAEEIARALRTLPGTVGITRMRGRPARCSSPTAATSRPEGPLGCRGAAAPRRRANRRSCRPVGHLGRAGRACAPSADPPRLIGGRKPISRGRANPITIRSNSYGYDQA